MMIFVGLIAHGWMTRPNPYAPIPHAGNLPAVLDTRTGEVCVYEGTARECWGGSSEVAADTSTAGIKGTLR